MRWFVLVAVAALVLSGCSSKDTGGSGGTSTTTTGKGGGGGGVTTTTSGGGGGGGGSGAGIITVYLNRTTIDGAAPLKVNFTLAATFKGSDGKAGHPTPTITVTFRQTADGNGTAVAGNAENGPSVASLPGSFSLTFTKAGKYEVVATVKANGYKDGQGTVIILPRAPGSTGAGSAIFFDGGEGDASQWTIASTVYLVQNIAPAGQGGTDTGAPYKSGCNQSAPQTPCVWAQDALFKTGTKSWRSNYPDNYRGIMTSKDIPLPAGSTPHRLSFVLKGGVEQNTFDGLVVSIGKSGSLTDGALIEDTLADWTPLKVDIPASLNGGSIQVAFIFLTDGSCSDETSLPDNPALACGAGSDQGGYWIDDITLE